MAYAEWWRISEAFMNAYYKQKGFTAQKEEQVFQRGVTERTLVLAEESADLARTLQAKQIELLESAETRAVSAEGRAVAVEGRADVQGELESEFARQILQAQLESLQLGNKWTRGKIRSEGISDTLADQLMAANNAYREISPPIFNAVASGDYGQVKDAFIQFSLDPALLPDEDTYLFNIEKESMVMINYFRKIVIDSTVKLFPEIADKGFRTSFGELANIEDLLQVPEKVKKARKDITPSSVQAGDVDPYAKGLETLGEKGFQGLFSFGKK